MSERTIEKASDPRSGRLRAARLITEALAPVVLIFVLLLVVGLVSAADPLQGLVLGLLAAMFAGGLPYLLLLRGVRSGRLGDRHLKRREERPLMMAIGLVSVAVGLLLVWWLGAPRELFALMGAMVAGAATALAISMFWKISIHTACMAGSVAVLTVVLGPLALLLSPLVVAVAWARVVLRDHTPAQVVGGALIGAAVAAGVMASLA